jgi:hypothetical protein
MWTENQRQKRRDSQRAIWANRSLEEKYNIIEKIAKKTRGKRSPKKGLSWEEQYGIERAKEIREKASKVKKGHKLTQEHKNKISIALKGHKKPKLSQKQKEQISLTLKELWKQSEYADYMKKSRRPGFDNKQYRKKRSELSKRLWKDSDFVKKQMQARGARPNKYEQKLETILNEIVPNEYKYVGDGQFIIDGKCPDFLNINGKKKLIELWGGYWHKGQNPQDRIDIFKPFGFDTLVIWANELNDINGLKSKLLTFNGEVAVS